MKRERDRERKKERAACLLSIKNKTSLKNAWLFGQGHDGYLHSNIIVATKHTWSRRWLLHFPARHFPCSAVQSLIKRFVRHLNFNLYQKEKIKIYINAHSSCIPWDTYLDLGLLALALHLDLGLLALHGGPLRSTLWGWRLTHEYTKRNSCIECTNKRCQK